MRVYLFTRYLPFIALAFTIVLAHFGVHAHADPLLP
jgi:hypothetical protein